ncbi:MAG TPA: pyruvate dehydrogenase complex dihydrolipoamide acetyltransferase [Candidatus Binatia bacterium]|nr:pyruvate dehydrogenase complex dihydrolipoamide acetyltransferase [Candidatus Binatia bacterium]
MATKVHMEALSPTMEEGQLVTWLKAEGDEVTEGDVLAEIETDKATMELVARGAGVLRKQLLAEGGTAPVGTVIGVIGDPDEDISELVEGAGASAADGGEAEGDGNGEGEDAAEGDEEEAEGGDESAGGEDGDATDAEPDEADAAEPEARDEGAPGKKAARKADARPDAARDEEGAERPDDGRLRASPLARRLAEEQGLDLRSIDGSGPGGRIVKRDIERAAEEGPARPAAAADAPGAAGETVKVSQMRKAIARRLVQSIGPVPTFYLTIEADVGRLLELRGRINERLEERGEKASVNDLILKATAEALRRHPEVNASWQGDTIERYGRVHLGVAVAIDDGLITPVIRDADRKGIADIAREVRELAGRARDKKLKPEEYQGATFSVSNLGMFGIQEFTAIINPPEAGILAIGTVEEKPVVVDGEVAVRPRMRVTMSCDHRVVDGAMGARFLATLRDFLEDPMMMVM